jgi:hypothetical protein
MFHSIYVVVPCHVFHHLTPSFEMVVKSDLFSSKFLLLVRLYSLVNISFWKIRSRQIYMLTQVSEH